MGFFSWKTQDTNKSIPSTYAESRNTFPVTMTDNKGNKWHEDNYEGYGVFGGKDYYELLAEMNGIHELRDAGIRLDCGERHVIYPNLTEDKDWKWKDEEPKRCEHQGFFY